MPDIVLDLRHLRYALVAAEQGSFRKAADALDISQSTLSRRINILENRLGFVLFERTRLGLRLSRAGENFLKEAAEGVTQFERAIQSASSAHHGFSGELRVGFLVSLAGGFLHYALKEFRRRHPDVRLRLHEVTTLENLHRLALGHLDVRSKRERVGRNPKTGIEGRYRLDAWSSSKLRGVCVVGFGRYVVDAPTRHPLWRT